MSPRRCGDYFKVSRDSRKTRVVKLAVACYDLSSLVAPTWDFLCDESCHHPDTMLYQKSGNSYACNKSEHVIPASINLRNLCRPKCGSPLTEFMLAERNTCLKVEAFLSAPTLHIKFDVLTSTRFYKRMFVTLFDEKMAVSLLNELLLRNEPFYDDIVTRSPLQRGEAREVVPGECLTGFVIDNTETFSFFVEGPDVTVAEIRKQFMYTPSAKVKIFYHSGNKFEERLYADFLLVGGLYVITLYKPLGDILAQEKIYVEGNVPFPCWQALKKLDLLFRCFTSKDMMQFSLFPTSEELYSLDLEWGVPVRWAGKVVPKPRRGTFAGVFM